MLIRHLRYGDEVMLGKDIRLLVVRSTPERLTIALEAPADTPIRHIGGERAQRRS